MMNYCHSVLIVILLIYYDASVIFLAFISLNITLHDLLFKLRFFGTRSLEPRVCLRLSFETIIY